MKKLLFSLFAVCMCLFCGTFIANASYPSFPTHLNGDSNFILLTGTPQSGTAHYADRSSLVVEKYEPPQYIIDINVCSVPKADRGYTDISRVQTYRFFYNWDLRQMYIDQDGNSNWKYIAPGSPRAYSMISKPAGEMAFYLAYGMKFYGSSAGYHSDFYKRAK